MTPYQHLLVALEDYTVGDVFVADGEGADAGRGPAVRRFDLSPEDCERAKVYMAARSARRANGCLEWTLALNGPRGRGRPIAHIAGRRFIASRLAWYLAHGAIPDGLLLCHRCDNPKCVDVEHLFLGTAADNNLDRDRKGRHRPLHGVANGLARHTDEEVAQAVAKRHAGATYREIAEEYGVSITAIWSWTTGRSRRAAGAAS